MSTTEPTRTDDPGPGGPLPPGKAGPAAALTAVFAVAGLAIYLVGLPDSPDLFGTPLSDLTLPVALFVALAGTSLVFAVLTSAEWRVVDIVVASVLGVAG